METRLTGENLLKGHNSGKNQSKMTSKKYAHLQVMETISEKFHKNPLKTVGGVAETRTSVDKMAKKGHNSGKKGVKRDLGIKCTSSGHGNNNWKVSSKSLENCRKSCGDKTYC